jgi:hypothetical protein
MSGFGYLKSKTEKRVMRVNKLSRTVRLSCSNQADNVSLNGTLKPLTHVTAQIALAAPMKSTGQ